MIIIITNLGATKAETILKKLNIEGIKTINTIWNAIEDDTIPLNERLEILNRKYPKAFALLAFHNYRPNDFIKIVKSFCTKERILLIYFGEEDYIFFKHGKSHKRMGNELARIVDEALTKYYNPVHNNIQKFGNLKGFRKIFETNKEFVERIEYIFSNMDININLLYDLMYRPTKEDFFLFKLLYVLHAVKQKDYSFFRVFRGDPEDENADFEARTFVSIMNKYTSFKIKLEDIYEEVSFIALSEDIIDKTAFKNGNPHAMA